MTDEKNGKKHGDAELEAILKLFDALLHSRRIADEAADERAGTTSFQNYFDDYCRIMVDDDATDEQIRMAKWAFMAGVIGGFEAVFSAFDPLKKMTKGSAEYIEKNRMLDNALLRRQRETREFAKELMKIKLMREAGMSGMDPANVHVMSLSEVVAELNEHYNVKKEKKE